MLYLVDTAQWNSRGSNKLYLKHLQSCGLMQRSVFFFHISNLDILTSCSLRRLRFLGDYEI